MINLLLLAYAEYICHTDKPCCAPPGESSFYKSAKKLIVGVKLLVSGSSLLGLCDAIC